MKSIQFITIILLTFISVIANAQDIHYSQFWNTPLLQNPSFAGKSDNDIRAIVNHKSQWGSVTSNPFRTFGVNLDMRIKTSSKDDHFGGGISMYTDVAGASKMRTTLVNFAAAYHIKIDNQNFLSTGLQAGFNQKSIDSDNLRFDNQFSGTGHNSGISSNEKLTNLSEVKPTVSGGLSYMWSNSFKKSSNRFAQRKKEFNIGLAVHHFNAPSFHFANQEKLGLKYIASFEGSFESSSPSWTVKPAAFVAIQNKATDIVFGSLFEYTVIESSQLTDFNKNVSIGLGAYYRFKDAIIPTFQVHGDLFSLGLSYDMNLSQLSGVSKGNGGFEISLKYSSLTRRKSGARYF